VSPPGPRPENKKDMQQVLGFTNFYWRSIRAFSDIAWPFFDLKKKGVAWHLDRYIPTPQGRGDRGARPGPSG
jgi:hypothetical protein